MTSVSYQSLIRHYRLMPGIFPLTKTVCVITASVLSSRVFFTMQISKSNLGLCCSFNSVSLIIHAVTLSLLLAGCLRIEMKLNYQDAKLAAVERICTERTQDMSQEDTTDVKGKKYD